MRLHSKLSRFRTLAPLGTWMSMPVAWLVTGQPGSTAELLTGLALSTIAFWAGDALTGAGQVTSRFTRTWQLPLGHRAWGHSPWIGLATAGLLWLAAGNALEWSVVLLAFLVAPVLNGWLHRSGWQLAGTTFACGPLLWILQQDSPSWVAPCGLLVGFLGHLAVDATHKFWLNRPEPPA